MSCSLIALLDKVVLQIRAVDEHAKVHDEDPLLTRDPKEFRERCIVGDVVHFWSIENTRTSTDAAGGDTSHHDAEVTIAGYFSMVDNQKREVWRRADQVMNSISQISSSRRVFVVGVVPVTIGTRFVCYKATITALFFALVAST